MGHLMIYRTVILRIPIDQVDAARAHIHATVPETLGAGVEHVELVQKIDEDGEPVTDENDEPVMIPGDTVTASYFDLPWRDEYFERLIDEAADFGATYWVRRNPRTNDQGEPIDPTAASMREAALEHGEVRAPIDEPE